ncbi:MAG: VOC family protein [Pseudomonadota bacterium]
MRLDHLAIAATNLDEGTAWAEEKLGVKLLPGGQHARFATHNTLLGLVDGLYLEVIAPNPNDTPERPRWFGLDEFSGPPRLVNWICNVPDLDAALADAPPMENVPMQRGELRWDIAVPEGGHLPMGGGFPTLIQWHSSSPPGQSLPASGLRLTGLTIEHPFAEALADDLTSKLNDDRIDFKVAGTMRLSATFSGPDGEVHL